MVDLLFLYILFLGGGFVLFLIGGMEISKSGYESQWGVDYKQRRNGLICLTCGVLAMMLCMLPIMGGWGILMALGLFLLIPANEFSRIAWELPYYEEEKINKAKSSRVLVYVLFGIVELVAFRLMLGSVLA